MATKKGGPGSPADQVDMFDQGVEQMKPEGAPMTTRQQNPHIIAIHEPQNLRQAGPKYFRILNSFSRRVML